LNDSAQRVPVKHLPVERIVDLGKFLTDRGIEHVKIGVFDTDGIFRGKYLSRDKFL
jgi:glutamine synthetase